MMQKKTKDLIVAFLLAVDIVCMLWILQYFNPSIDLSEDKRFTLSDGTVEQLSRLEDEVTVELLLDGDIPPGFIRLKNQIIETVYQMQQKARVPVYLKVSDPLAAKTEQEIHNLLYQLGQKGIQPTQIFVQENGKQSEKLILPAAIIRYKGKQVAVNFLNKASVSSSSEALNESVEMVEFNLTSALKKVTTKNKKRIAILTGHGEPTDIALSDIYSSLIENYIVQRTTVQDLRNGNIHIAILAKPILPFTEEEKLVLDQFVIHGGRLLLLLDKCYFDADSLKTNTALAFPLDLNLDDLLFRFGVRINNNLIADLQALPVPVVQSSLPNTAPQIQLFPWKFTPIITTYASHPITKNMGAVAVKYASSIDTVKAKGITKTPLFWASNYSKTYDTPYKLDLKKAKAQEDPTEYNSTLKPLAYLLEGVFTSLYRNRLTIAEKETIGFKESQNFSKIIVVSDGDLIINEVSENGRNIFPLGFERSIRKTFANKDLVRNMIDYLADEETLLAIRNKEIKLRPLDKAKIKENRSYYQWMNVLAPIFAMVFIGFVFHYYRARKYGK